MEKMCILGLNDNFVPKLHIFFIAVQSVLCYNGIDPKGK